MPGVLEKTFFDGDIESAYNVISDYEAYPDILSDIIAAEVIEQKRNRSIVRFELKIVRKFFYTLALTAKKNKEVVWELVESDIMKSNVGRWGFAKHKNQTEATYEIDVTFGLLVPKMIVNAVVKGNLPKMFEEFNQAIRG